MYNLMSEERRRWEIERTSHLEEDRLKFEKVHLLEISEKEKKLNDLQSKITELHCTISEYKDVCKYFTTERNVRTY